jgi:hypothetical protein
MVRKLVALAGVLALAVSAGGCFSLNMDENILMIDHLGKDMHEMRVMTNKYFFGIDTESPFLD